MHEKILIIEDEVEFAAMVQLRLTLDGYQCDVKHHTLQGMRAFGTGAYDLLVLDLMIPGGGGFAVLNQRNQNKLTDIPVVVVTGRTITPELKSRLRQYGVSSVLNKPYDPQFFSGIIKKCIAQSKGVKNAAG